MQNPTRRSIGPAFRFQIDGNRVNQELAAFSTQRVKPMAHYRRLFSQSRMPMPCFPADYRMSQYWVWLILVFCLHASLTGPDCADKSEHTWTKLDRGARSPNGHCERSPAARADARRTVAKRFDWNISYEDQLYDSPVRFDLTAM